MGWVFEARCEACDGGHLFFALDRPSDGRAASYVYRCPATWQPAVAVRTPPAMLSDVRPTGSVLAISADE